MLLTMGVSLYTVRIVLSVLGVEDYGIYNVVGGIVATLSFLSNTMATASQRFFAFDMGRKDYQQLKKTFSTTLLIFISIGLAVLILAETIGLWFLNNKIVIPNERTYAANWVYQFAIFSFIMTMITVPYNALVIAHERMDVFAWVSILEVTLKLIIVYILVIFDHDKLILYAILTFIVTTIISSIYRIYCKKSFKESNFQLVWDSRQFSEITSYSGWNLFGAIAGVFNNQGRSIVLNLFFGPTVNAAQGIAYQINSVINQFASNIMTASRPQITKLYAKNQHESMMELVFQSTKFSYFLLYMVAVPLFWKADFFLGLWLTDLPENVVIFTKLVLVISLIDSLSYSIMAAVQATGKIKNYQLVVGICFMLNLPISYMVFKLNYPPYSTFTIGILTAVICFVLRIIMMKRVINFRTKKLFESVILPVAILTLVSSLVNLFLFNSNSNQFLGISIRLLGFYLITPILIYAIGLNRSDRNNIRSLITNKFL
jgi:O-antigen/teichoic acid export membrane protein